MQNTIPIYNINLDLPPLERWRQVAIDFRQQIKDLISLVNQEICQKYPQEILQIIHQHGQNYDYLDFNENIKALSQLLDVSFYDLFIINIMYELDSNENIEQQKQQNECTSIIIRNAQKRIMLCRNWDYFHAQSQLAALQIQADFYKKDKLVCSAIMPACTVIPHSGIKNGKFAISFNLRRSGQRELNIDNLLLKKGFAQAKYLLLDTLLNADNYNDAVQKLSQTKTAAPVFYTVGGINENEGIAIAKDRETIYTQFQLDSKVWYVVIANTDVDKSNHQNDPRRIGAITSMEKLGQNIKEEEVFQQVLNKNPVLCQDTILTILFSAVSGDNKIYKQFQ